MWSVNCRKILNFISGLWLAIGLGACSVSTIGNVDSTTSPHFQKIALPEVNNRARQLMNRSLTDYVGYFDSVPHYALSYELSSASRSVLSSAGVSSSLDTTKMSVSYSLQDIRTGEVLTDGSMRPLPPLVPFPLFMARIYRLNLPQKAGKITGRTALSKASAIFPVS